MGLVSGSQIPLVYMSVLTPLPHYVDCLQLCSKLWNCEVWVILHPVLFQNCFDHVLSFAVLFEFQDWAVHSQRQLEFWWDCTDSWGSVLESITISGQGLSGQSYNLDPRFWFSSLFLSSAFKFLRVCEEQEMFDPDYCEPRLWSGCSLDFLV